MEGLSVRITGIVQGVGFRPFIYSLADRLGLKGWVRNTSGEVEIEIDGRAADLARFLRDLRIEAPPLARIDGVQAFPRRALGYEHFEIVGSIPGTGWQPIPPDAATCESCLEEVFDPRRRRYRYPFTNCTHCGPRFTIIERLPYDRSATTMRRFEMCADCRREYGDPRDRRFHAQPIACPRCGPRLWLHVPGAGTEPGDPVESAIRVLEGGGILALKGLGGYQLACDAARSETVSALRARKHRYGKPFALMVPDARWAHRLCRLSPLEAEVLSGRERPIVLAKRRTERAVAMDGAGATDGAVATEVAPGLDTLGLMRPYTPLHHLLLAGFGRPLVMTSGNISDEPIATGDWEALERLSGIADAFLIHDREIRARYDDSVVRILAGAPVPIRRARGYAPVPIPLPFEAEREILACGAQQKSTFCLVKGHRAFISPHIGDLETLETLEHFEDSLELFRELFGVEPSVIAHDLHPDYLSTRFAHGYGDGSVPRVGVQHHHAQVVSAMVEHGIEGPVIGVAYDGTGYGTDGAVWGGEVMVAEWGGFRRVGHLRYVPLPGGAAAIRRPYRMAVSYIRTLLPDATGEFRAFLDGLPAGELTAVEWQLEAGIHAPPTSSCGRLFDAVSALLGVRPEAAYEGQPAVELEAVADPRERGMYPFDLTTGDHGWIVDPGPMLRRLWRDRLNDVTVGTISGRFHNTVAAFTRAVCEAVREETGLDRVVVSGGCFQSALLTRRTAEALSLAGFGVYTHAKVPPNDGGLSLGQAAVAHALVRSAE